MPAITFTNANKGIYTGGYSGVGVPKRTTGSIRKRMSELLKTTGCVLPRYSTHTPKSIIAHTNIVWSNLFNKKLATSGILPALVGRTTKQISQTTSYTGAMSPKFGGYKRVSIYGVYRELWVKKTTGFGPLPKIGTNLIPFSVVWKTTGARIMYTSTTNAKIKMWYSTVVGDSGDTTQANIQFWS
jgi:hypothetical protein